MSFPGGSGRLGRTTDLIVFSDPIAGAALAHQVAQMPDAGLGWVAAAIGVVSQIIPLLGNHPDPNTASQIMSRMAAAATQAGNDAQRNDFLAHLIGAARNPSNGWWVDITDGTHLMPDTALLRVHEVLEHGSTGDFYPSPDQYNALATLAVAAGMAQQTAGGAPPVTSPVTPPSTNPLTAILNAIVPHPTTTTPLPTTYRAPLPTTTTAGLSNSTLALGLIGAVIIGGIMLGERGGSRGRRR